MNNKKELPIEEIVKEWEEGKTLEELAKKYGVSYGTISNRINSFYNEKGEERPKPKRSRNNRKELPVEEIVKEWEEGTTQKELAKKYGVAYLTINDRINKYYEEKGEERTKPKREKELPVEEIVKEWKEGKTLEELVKKYGVSNSTIRKRINKYYEEKEEEKTKPKRERKLPIEEIVKEWKEGKTQEELAKKYGVSNSTINIRINKFYEEKEEEKIKPKREKELPIEEIIKEWKEGKTQEELAKKYGVSYVTISNRINSFYKEKGEERPKPKRSRNNRKELPVEEIVKEWEEGKTQKELAKKYGVSNSTIKKRINKFYEEKEKPQRERKIKLPIEEIIKEWEEGITQRELAKKYGVAYLTINKRIIKYYEEKGIKRPKPKREKKLPIEEIVKEWEEGKTQRELAKKYGVAYLTINKRINKFYVAKGKEKPKRERKIELPIEEIVKEWEEGKTQEELGKKYGVSYGTISIRINKFYEEKGKEKPKRKPNSKQRERKIELPIEEIVKEWEEGTTQRELAKKYGVSYYAINNGINKFYEEKGKEKPKRKPNSKQRERKIELPIEEIVKEWEEGKTQKELAKKYGVSYVTINIRIIEFYEERGKEKPKGKRELPIEEIVKEWEEGKTQKELAKKYGVTDSTISIRISKFYEEKGKEKPQRERKIELPIEEIVKEWEEGTTQRELAKKYGVSYEIIRNRINKFYVEKGKEKPPRERKIELPIEEIVKERKEGKTHDELAKKYGVSNSTIGSRISKYYEEKGKEKPKRKPRGRKIELQIEEIVKEWEEGIALEELAIKYTTEKKSLNSEIEKYFKQIGIRKLLRKPDIIIEYLRKGLSIEQVQEIAKKSNVYIPKFIKETAIEKNMKIDDKEEKER